MSKRREKLLQWHPAFFAGIQIELADEAENLIFENEHNLGTKPMQIDVLIIKKNPDIQLKKNIGQLFRKYNIIEYKSPDDYLSIDDFYKVYGYACFYKADTAHTNRMRPEELTITFVCNHYPRKFIHHLATKRGIIVTRRSDGIYYLDGDLFPMQLIISSRLSEDNNLWLRNLTNNIRERKTAEKLISAYAEHNENSLYKSVMNIIVHANTEQFKEAKNMCEALLELFKEELDEREQLGISKGMSQGISQGISKGKHQLLTEQIFKKIQKGKNLSQIAEELEDTIEVIQPLYNQLIMNL